MRFGATSSCVLALSSLASAGVFANAASAQEYPTKFVRYLVHDAVGSGSDTIGRIVAEGLGEVIGQQVVVDNRAGAGGTIGAAIAAKAPPDGYTLFQASSAIAASAMLYGNLPYDMMRDFAAVTLLASSPLVVVVHPSLPVKSIGDLIKLAKTRPGQINCASAGVGTSTFVTAELFKSTTAVDMTNVPYKGGGPALVAVVAGESPVYFAPLAASLPLIRSGRLRALGVTTSKRVALLPDSPTVAESGYRDFNTGNWYALMVPAKTPQRITAKIHDATVSVLSSVKVNRRLVDLGYIIGGDRPEECAANIRSEIDRLAKVFKQGGVKPN